MGDTKITWCDAIASVFSLAHVALVAHNSARHRQGVFYKTMTEFNPYDDPFTRNLVQKKAKQLVGKYGYTSVDRDDIEQNIYLRVLQSWPSYDEAEGHHHKFVTAVIERYVANIVRDRCAEKRYDGATILLSAPLSVTDGESLRVSNTLTNNSQDKRLGRRQRGETDLSQLRLDVLATIESLPDCMREIVELRKSKTITEIAAKKSVARTTVSGWFRKIRDHFEAAGLADYFDDSSSLGR